MDQNEVKTYPQKAESLAHINITATITVATQSASICVVVVVVHTYAVLPGAQPFIMRPVRVATAIKCHFHSGDCFFAHSTDSLCTMIRTFKTFHLFLIKFNWNLLYYYLRNWMHPLYMHFLIAFSLFLCAYLMLRFYHILLILLAFVSSFSLLAFFRHSIEVEN